MITRTILAVALASGILSRAAADEALPKITISYSQQVGDELPLFVTQDGGYFKKNGLDATVTLLPAQQGIPALLNGQVQFCSIGAGDALAAAAQGLPVKYVAAFAPVYVFGLWVRPEYASAEKLKGQKVAVASFTGTSYLATVLELRQLGLAPGDVIITPLGSAQNTAAALMAGSIAATSSIPPITYEFEKRGFVNLVDLMPKRIPNLTAGLLALDSYVASHHQIVQEAVDAFAQGLQRDKTDKKFAEQVIAGHLAAKGEAAVDQTYEFYRASIDQDWPMPEPGMLESAQSILGLQNAKIKTVDVNAMIDRSFVADAMARMTGK